MFTFTVLRPMSNIHKLAKGRTARKQNRSDTDLRNIYSYPDHNPKFSSVLFHSLNSSTPTLLRPPFPAEAEYSSCVGMVPGRPSPPSSNHLLCFLSLFLSYVCSCRDRALLCGTKNVQLPSRLLTMHLSSVCFFCHCDLWTQKGGDDLKPIFADFCDLKKTTSKHSLRSALDHPLCQSSLDFISEKESEVSNHQSRAGGDWAFVSVWPKMCLFQISLHIRVVCAKCPLRGRLRTLQGWTACSWGINSWCTIPQISRKKAANHDPDLTCLLWSEDDFICLRQTSFGPDHSDFTLYSEPK